MAEDSFILVNLKEDKAKKLAQVISNETSRKILDFLVKKEASESEIAKELNIPISTIHYSLMHLKEVNLVQVDEFHYSKKGKVVDHYKLSNKMVIIAPMQPSVESIKDRLMKLFPAFLVSIAGAATLRIIKIFQNKSLESQAIPMMMKAMDAEIANVAANDGAMLYASRTIEPIAQTVSGTDIALWFFVGTIFALAAYLIVDIIKYHVIKIKNKK